MTFQNSVQRANGNLEISWTHQDFWQERSLVLDLTRKAEFTKLAAKAILANQERGNRDVCWGEGWHAKVNQGLQKGQGLGWGEEGGRNKRRK